nr:microfibril-associated glycoprotein 4-like isoform X1 [Aedes albopictus]
MAQKMASGWGVLFIVTIVALVTMIAPATSDSCNSGKLRVKLESLERKILEMKSDFDRNQRRIEQTLDKILEQLNKADEAAGSNEDSTTKRADKYSYMCSERGYGCQKLESCSDAMKRGLPSGRYLLELPGVERKSFLGYCDQNTSGGGWLVMQSRVDGSMSFEKDWNSYEKGFGVPEKNFWIGLEKLHLLTRDQSYELRIELENCSVYGLKEGNIRRHAAYDDFEIGSAADYYKLKKLGQYSGSAGDSMSNVVGANFSTYDADHDDSVDNCASITGGGWWLRSCSSNDEANNLNCVYNGLHWRLIELKAFISSCTGLKMLIRAKSVPS